LAQLLQDWLAKANVGEMTQWAMFGQLVQLVRLFFGHFQMAQSVQNKDVTFDFQTE
jgi:hypothetical protein